MKRIKLLTLSAGPKGTTVPGEYDVSDEEAEALVASGCGQVLGNVARKIEPPEPVEVETAEDQQEKREEAVKPRRRGRRRGR